MISSSTRPRRAIAVAAVLLAAVDVAAVSAQAQAADSHSRPELGFRIGQNSRADGSWLGRYRIGHQLGYRIQPRKSNAQSAYHPARRVTRAAGAGRVATERSAWVLSTYGRTTDLTTAAAVDVAVNALLNGGKWRLGTAYTAHRTSHTGNGRFIRAYARAMLRQSKHRHGPYRTTLTATRVPAGDQTTVTVRIQNKHGLGPVITGQQRGLAVDVSYPRAGTKTVFMNSRGVGRVFFRAAAGRTRLTAKVRPVPDAALLLRRPWNTAASVIAVAGHHQRLKLRGVGLGISPQSVSISNGSASVLVGHRLRGAFSVAGLTGHETVDYAVYGPFTTAATRCSGTPLMTAKDTVTSNGTQSLPAWSPSRTGYYAWKVAARGNLTTRPASACGTAYLTQKGTATQQSRLGSDATVRLGHAFGVEILVSGFDRPEVHTVATRVYGPFLHKDNTRCTPGRLFRTLPASISTNKRWTKTTVVGSGANTGYYVFQTTLHAGTFMRGSHSHCGDPVQVTK